MKHVIRSLRNEGESLKKTDPTREPLTSFVSKVKTSIKESVDKEINSDARDLLDSIDQFKTFDELNWIGRMLHRMMISRYRSHAYDNWKEKGKYQYDFDALILKLDALLFRLENSK